MAPPQGESPSPVERGSQVTFPGARGRIRRSAPSPPSAIPGPHATEAGTWTRCGKPRRVVAMRLLRFGRTSRTSRAWKTISDRRSGWVLPGSAGALLLLVSGGNAPSQTPLLTLLPEPATFDLGRAVAAAGDLNADGTPDVLLGEPEAHGPAGRSGRIRVFSGASTVVLLLVNGDSADDDFGSAVAGGADVDADGVPDVLVGAPLHDTGGLNAGRAKLISGASGTVLQTWDGASTYDSLGAAVSWAGDVDGDGVPDALVGAPGRDAG